jgi:TatD DNase family protein
MELVDSHCHLPLLDDARATAEYLAAAATADVRYVLCVAVDFETLPGVLATTQHAHNVFASVGVHPNSEQDRIEPTVNDLLTAASDSKVIAIGETGLDYYRQVGDLSGQQQRFRNHIRAAVECQKPLIIHTRESAADVIKILREENATRIGGVMHCFVEDWATAEAAMELGFYISFSGIVTFKSATALQAVAARVPCERLLVETDAPWLAPIPYRGRPNEPAFVRHTAEFLAKLRDESLATVARYTTQNFFDLFKSAHRTPVI